MADKVIHEVRFIETDDGFRVEIKGDKEQIRKMGLGHGFGPGMGFGHGFGPGMGFMRRHRRRMARRYYRMGHAFGPGYGYGPWWDEEPEHGEAPSEAV